MARNLIQEGDVLTLVAPAAVNSGQLVVVNQMFGVANHSAVSAANVECTIGGVWDLPKANAVSTSAAAGANIHWDATNARTTISASSNLKIGVAAVTSTNTATTVRVRLNESF
jgi:predicted RecA/RadA family phage recombinase